MKIAYQCFATGEYVGPIECYDELLPNGATWETPPDAKAGFARFYKNGKWQYIEDHRKEEGYVDGVRITIHEVGPLPEGWSTEPPAPTPEQQAAMRRQEILTALDRIDRASSRSLRAILTAQAAGTEPAQADVQVLATYEAEAVALREELAALNA